MEGFMKSTVCHLGGSEKEIKQILKEAEKTAAYVGLRKHETLQLCLLAEELTGILRGVIKDFEADFWIEEENGKIRLNLASEVRLEREKKEKLLSISTSGKNEADKGIMGKIGRLFETYMDNCDEVGTYCAQAGITIPSMEMMDSGSMMTFGGYGMWSLQEYKNYVQTEKKEEAWDELECSIVAKLADDVTVSIRNQKVHLTVIKVFQ